MPKKKASVGANESAPKDNSTLLQPDDGVTVPRLKMGETGFAALKTRNGRMYEEANKAFQYPGMLKVVAEMELSPPVSIGLNAINMLLNRAQVFVEPVVGATEEEKARAEFLMSCLDDMDTSWQTTLQSISTYLKYGHAVHEMVFRRRLNKNGSKFNDGLVGIKGLKPRPQNSIAKWNFSEDGRTLQSISQSLTNVENNYRFKNLADENGFIVIPREKVLLFRADPVNDNPEGTSILRAAYLAYKQLTILTENMLVGVAKDSAGLPLIQIPPKYMDANASPEDKAVYQMCQNIVENLASGTSRGIVFPLIYDPESKLPMFEVSLLEQKGGKAYNVESIIRGLQETILSVLSCDAVKMGSDKAGSFSLQDGDTNTLAMSVSYRLSEIAGTLNSELIPALWAANGWDASRAPTIKFKDISSVSLEEHSKWCQRVFSVGGIEVDREVLNKIREVGGFKLKPEDEPVDYENLSTTLAGKSSNAGEGMAVGKSGDGTANIGGKSSGQDKSTRNSENKA